MTVSPGSNNDPRFVEYYARESLSDKARDRAFGIQFAVMRARAAAGAPLENLNVADIGCNAGTQSQCWLERGHRVAGVDISQELINIARRRNSKYGYDATYTVGTATRLPWTDRTFDVCLLPELLEHVDDWQSCIEESIRVLKIGGTLYLSTTNVLCPMQQEFRLPAYSWYPKLLKDYAVKLARTTQPQLANFATHPAVHWFNPYGLARYLSQRKMCVSDRFDLIDTSGRSGLVRLIVEATRLIAPLRFLGHVCTPSTTLVAHRSA